MIKSLFVPRTVLALAVSCVALLGGGAATAAAAQTSDIIISEFRTQGVANGDFVELLNISNAPVTLTANGWTIFNMAADGNSQCIVVFNQPAVTIQAGQHYLITQSGWSGAGNTASNKTMGACGNLHDAGGSLIFTDLGTGKQDAVGYGTANGSTVEGTKFNPIATGTNSNNRKQLGRQDTDNNSTDFQIGAAEPENANVVDPVDSDGDGVADSSDNCSGVANANQLNADGDAQGDACDADDDNDGVPDASDNCTLALNANQLNTDGDAQGDVCDADDDNDGTADGSDNCSLVANSLQTNTDGDAQGDACDADDDADTVVDGNDNCPLNANTDQLNTDGDAQGNVCDADDDGDAKADGSDNCPVNANADQLDTDADGQGDACDADDDADTKADGSDNCPLKPNTDQANTDGDLEGDACDTDDDGDGVIDTADGCALVAAATANGCPAGTKPTDPITTDPTGTAPGISGLAVNPKRFRSLKAGATLVATGGAAITFTAATAETVQFSIARASGGRRSGGRCVTQTRSNAKKPRCLRFSTMATFGQAVSAGAATLHFSGRINGKRLRRGTYRLTAVPTLAGGATGKAAAVTFRVI
jgi:hypothetical protein